MTAVAHDALLLQTADILELMLDAENEGPTRSSDFKKKLLQNVSNFRQEMSRAKDYAKALSGGELLVEEQDEIIEMLEQLKQRKRHILDKFAQDVGQRSLPQKDGMTKDEVDSTASTPAG